MKQDAVGDNWTGRVKHEEVLQGVWEKRNIIRTIKRRKDNWIGRTLRRSSFFLKKQVNEGKLEGMIDVTGRRGRKCKQLLYDLKEKRGYWKFKDALDRTMWRTRLGRGHGPVVRQATGLKEITMVRTHSLRELLYRLL